MQCEYGEHAHEKKATYRVFSGYNHVLRTHACATHLTWAVNFLAGTTASIAQPVSVERVWDR